MNAPAKITFIRHAESAFNRHKLEWQQSELYKEFVAEYTRDWQSDKSKDLAILVAKEFSVFNTDHSTDLTEDGRQNARHCGKALAKELELPDVVIVSPYLRTRKTYDFICESWPELAEVDCVLEERIREQEFGLRLLYGDWRAMNVCHPEQRSLYALQGPYWYRQPQGENIPDVRERMRQWTDSINRNFGGASLLVVTHHVSILAFKANQERLSPEDFVASYSHMTPQHCAITQYRRNDINQDELELSFFNKSLV